MSRIRPYWATRNICGYRALGRCAYSSSRFNDLVEAADASLAKELRVGVLGLGAIGTIFFTRLGLLAINSNAKTELPTLKVDAFIKPEQFDVWTRKQKLQLCLEGKENEEKESLKFQVNVDKVATVCNAPNVRVCTLESAETDGLDVLLVAVKAYDSVGVIRELRYRNRHLLKDGALCVLLQNGLGEVPEEEAGGLGRLDDRWQFANGVTFVGGRVRTFGKVVTSGVDTGVTYLAPFGTDEGNHSDSDDEVLLRRVRDMKMETLGEIFRAAGLRCEVLEDRKMQAMLWRKLIVNAAINPLASLLDAPNKSVASSDYSRHCVNMVVQEALAVAQCEKIALSCTQDELVEEILDVARNTGTNVCSMLADLRRGSRTEIDAITGRIVEGGKRHGIPTPTNEILYSLIKALEKEETRRSDLQTNSNLSA
ncbi:2-dehydropantoate 2-reductase [Phytophthora palmivora]|uniref:2-dehydropantoate 2-reductase n=1 Tax=Phytophthora palmivora TaxID=4796 RepID=A0A2P4XTL3_9STRA|nr:2-dehydropantoate 2-reductase [Phytophthora palmivora]